MVCGKNIPLEELEVGTVAYLFHLDRDKPSSFVNIYVKVSVISENGVILERNSGGYFYGDKMEKFKYLSFPKHTYDKVWYLR